MPEFNTEIEDDTSSEEEFEGKNENDLGNKDTSGIEGDTLQYPPGFTLVDEENVVGNNTRNTSQPNPTKSGNNEKAPSDKDICNHGTKFQASGSILEVMDEFIKMNFLSLNIQGLGNKAKKGGILCVWDPSLFVKDNSMVSDSFLGILGDFNEVLYEHERHGSLFNSHGANSFNNFITMTGLIDLPLEGYSFTWAYKSDSKMSKLDRFLISKGLLALFPTISALCLDKPLSDHWPILLRELYVDYGPTPFWVFHSWSSKKGFDKMVEYSWKNSDCMLDKILDQGRCNDDMIQERSKLLKELQDFNNASTIDMVQKAKIQWAIEGDENSKFFHRIINKKQSQLAIHGVLVDGEWIINPSMVKKKFLKHFANCFGASITSSITFDSQFPNRLSPDQNADLERNVSYDEIKSAVWDCGTNKSPGLDAIYGVRGAHDNPPSYSRRSHWLEIVSEVRKLSNKGIDLLSLVKKKVDNGEETYFWNDVSPRSDIEQERLLLILNTSSVILPNIIDRWTWRLDSSGVFSVKSAREFIDDSFHPKTDVPTRWVKFIPVKINIFIWRVSLDKLPTSIVVESTSHLLFSYQLARQLMLKVVRWWELEYQDFLSYGDWLFWLNNLRVSKRFKDVFEGVCYITGWVI
ncbi:RNA-directed DNA polymerase, eukaryota [Tanacetum coccineum]